MVIKKWETIPNGCILHTYNGQMRLLAYNDQMIRVTYTKSPSFSEKESLMVVMSPEEVKTEVREEGNNVFFQTKDVVVKVDKITAAFTYLTADGKILTKEPDCGGKKIESIDIIKTVFDTNQETEQIKSVDGLKVVANNFHQEVDRKGYQTKLEFEWEENEAIYGLGSHEEGIFNYRGHHQYLYQHNMKACVPAFVSTNGYGVLVDTYSMLTFHDDAYGSYIKTDVDDEMDFYFIYGPELDQVVDGYRQLTGKAPMFPKWAFGYVQSKERYKSQEELLSVVREYRKRNIPLDMIVLDWRSWEGNLWGQKTFDPERFPNPAQMMEDLHKENAKLMISVWPNMAKGGSNHQEMQENGFLFGNQSTYNAFDEKARALYWKHTNEGLFAHGLDAWWCDCTEPFEADWKGEIKPEPEARVVINTNEARKYMDPEYVNAFSLMHSKGIYEGQRQTTDKKRVLNLTRSAYAGQHRYSAITWSGDISSKWETLKRQVPEGLNFCATGEPYWTQDIGGFFIGGHNSWSQWRKDLESPELWFLDGDFGQEGCKDLGYRELYLRWFQYGTFLPMFRSHGSDYAREVWEFGEPGTVFYDNLVKFIELRYQMMPYIYSLAGDIVHNNGTMMRLLAFDFRNDPEVYNIGDEYMFGPSLLVCPVTHPMYYDVNSVALTGVEKTREVYLPEGCKWYDFWTNQVYEGGVTFKAEAEIDRMPLYVKGGSILPMGPVMQYVDQLIEAPMELRVYPGADGTFTLYEDEGDNYNYEKGDFATTTFEWDDEEGTLTIGARQGEFKGFCKERVFNVVVMNGNEEDKQSVIYTGEAQSITMAR